ncbi:iron-containing redox enzyme family protein [Rickettsiales endosymbiont of Trichoplax sp. H2]|uniref:iron-containing redox enzyme family protein n=1 Tax=Rickettsiales endosymbiont of Trichoplax sp. H2 TaxID=2021221 RepID=UPI0012B386F2|nr:iron-containing redox enzyme family protein [Rickettsiales endosymbiont of Trichoplax sp. H2]MSO14525.1 hypothetical protein [Rickettsiales endosymbiont of Trichoplax sp. H2]
MGSQGSTNLTSYIDSTINSYSDKVKKLPLFDDDFTRSLTLKQKKLFIKIFYHARGKFHDFLWYVGSNTQNAKVKKIVIQNISEEFNGSAASHEEMYMHFANYFNVDLTKEFSINKYYIKSVQDFNNNHIDYLVNHSDDYRIAAFSAYEKLDNVDYPFLLKFASNIGAQGRALIFFKVHAVVEHFESTRDVLENIWEKNSYAVKKSFEFITNNQIFLWNSLFNEITKS